MVALWGLLMLNVELYLITSFLSYRDFLSFLKVGHINCLIWSRFGNCRVPSEFQLRLSLSVHGLALCFVAYTLM